MASPVEHNVLYSQPQDVCYGVLRDEVIPSLNLTVKAGYLGLKVPISTLGLSVVEDDWRAYKLIAKMRANYWLSSTKGITWGPHIKIYSRGMGPDTTMVEVVADAASFYDGQILNLWMDVTYKKIPGYSWFLRKMIPNYYFDETPVIDSKRLEDESFREGMGRTGLKYIFKMIHQMFEERLKERGVSIA